jgi:hypothetical protein
VLGGGCRSIFLLFFGALFTFTFQTEFVALSHGSGRVT